MVIRLPKEIFECQQEMIPKCTWCWECWTAGQRQQVPAPLLSWFACQSSFVAQRRVRWPEENFPPQIPGSIFSLMSNAFVSSFLFLFKCYQKLSHKISTTVCPWHFFFQVSIIFTSKAEAFYDTTSGGSEGPLPLWTFSLTSVGTL